VSNEYLWDRSGPPDPEIASLEDLLAPLAGSATVPAWVNDGPPTRRRLPRAFLAVAAALVLACGASLAVRQSSIATGAAWAVIPLAGSPRIGTAPIAQEGRLATGEWLVTDSNSRAVLDVSDIGRLEIDPGTRLQLLGTRDGHHRLALHTGTVHAIIWSPPGQFVVETPASTAVDLGCAYTLHVAPDGSGVIDVDAGWVAFAHDDREAFIPAGARCSMRPRVGPGTPYFPQSPDGLRQALTTLDFGSATPAARRAAVDRIIALAASRDAVSLWHVLQRIPRDERGPVVDALARLVPAPPSTTRDGIIAGNRAMLDAWWDELGYGSMDWWRQWQRRWP
jgi:hypothetical protein